MPSNAVASSSAAPLTAEVGLFAPAVTTDDAKAPILQDFLSEQHTLFLSLAKIHREAVGDGDEYGDDYDGPPSSHIPYYTRLFDLLVEFNHKLIHRLADQDDYDDDALSHHLPILTLTRTLYLPSSENHYGQGIVGEQLLHWLNQWDPAPTNEQGREIAADAEPHLRPDYWDYILRATVRGLHQTVSTMLALLLTLPSQSLQSLVARIRALLKAFPRSLDFKTEVQFKAARREFHLKLMGILSSLEAVMNEVQDEIQQAGSDEDDAEDSRLSLEAGLRIFLEVLAGNKERVIEAAEDWKEALAAWATLVDVGLKRDGLPDAMDKVQALRDDTQEQHPQAEHIMMHLFKGQVHDACQASAQLDPYLAQVLTDYSVKLGFSDSSTPRTDIHTANQLYANTLLSSYGLWRMAIDYLSHAGDDGRKRMSEVVLGVPLLEQHSSAPDSSAPDSSASSSSSEFHLVESVLSTCSTFDLLREAKAICKKMSLHLSNEKRYGPAIVYALRSPPRGDVTLIKTIVASVLDGLMSARASNTHATWLIEQVTQIKLSIIRAAREEQRAREGGGGGGGGGGDNSQAQPTAFLTRRKGGPLPGGLASGDEEDVESNDDSDALLLALAQEEEWNHHFSHSLPPALLFITNLSRYFELQSNNNSPTDQFHFLIEVLNSGLVPGDWISICLYEVRLCLQPTPREYLFDLLRIIENLQATAALSKNEENWALGKLAQWLLQEDGTNQSANEALLRLRLDVALALSLGALGGGRGGDAQMRQVHAQDVTMAV